MTFADLPSGSTVLLNANVLTYHFQPQSVFGPPCSELLERIEPQETGLLSNDALLVAVMRHHDLNRLASHDADFDRVPGLMRYAPV